MNLNPGMVSVLAEHGKSYSLVWVLARVPVNCLRDVTISSNVSEKCALWQGYLEVVFAD